MTPSPAPRSVAVHLRYTRIVVALGRTLTSLVMVTALAGSPALVSACLVACLPATAETAAAPHEAVAAAAAHAHHGIGADRSNTGAVTAMPDAHHGARIDGECHDCCARAADALDAGVAGERPAALAVALAPGLGAAHPARVALTLDERRVPPLVPPPAPVRASRVLRI